MKKRAIASSAAVPTALLMLALLGCKRSDSSTDTVASASPAASQATPPAKQGAAVAANVKIGDSCEGISATDGKAACDGNKIIFCSSYSKYKWKLQQECAAGTTCTAAADGKSAGCK